MATGHAEGTVPFSVDQVMYFLRSMLSKKGLTVEEACSKMREFAADRKVVLSKKQHFASDVVEASIARLLAEVGEGGRVATQGQELHESHSDASHERNGEKDGKEAADTSHAVDQKAGNSPPAGSEATSGAGASSADAGVSEKTKQVHEPEPEATPCKSASAQAATPDEAAPQKRAKAAAPDEAAPHKRAKVSSADSRANEQASTPPVAPMREATAKPKKETAKERKAREKQEQLAREAEAEKLAQERAAPFVGLSIAEMREKRMAEVTKEMDSRMVEIVQRTAQSLGQEPPSEDALTKLLSADVNTGHREDYLRLIHRLREEVRWPVGLVGELMPHQAEGLEWLVSIYANNLHGILADEMGLGKTIQTIALLQWLKEFKGSKGPHLVVAPKSTLTNWKAEFQKFAPKYKVWLLIGEGEDRDHLRHKLRHRIACNKSTLYITNYEQIHRNDWLLRRDWQLIIIDEGHRMKNQQSVLHQTMTKMKCRTRILLTGTPLQNNLNELWSLLHYLLPDLFASALDFQQWFLEPLRGVQGLNEYECSLRPEDEAMLISRLHTMLSPFLLQRTKAQVMEHNLPAKAEHVVRVELSAWQKSAYEDLQKRTIHLLTENDKVESRRVNNVLMQLRKIVLHPYLFTGTQEPSSDLFRVSGKLEVLDRILPKLARFGHKTLIFSQFTSALDILGQYLRWRDIRFARIDGQTRHEDRGAQIQAFNSSGSDLGVFLLSARAGGLGLNLQAADTVILFDLDWNPQNDKQAIARAHRYGQVNEVRVLRLLTLSGVEEHMERRCQEKLELERKIIGAGMFSRGASAEQRSDMLRSILGVGLGDGDASSPSGSSRGPVEPTMPKVLNEMLARSPEELAAFEDIDRRLLQQDAVEGSLSSLLVRSGRLMRPEDVPNGFRLDEEVEDEEEEAPAYDPGDESD